MLGGCFGSAAYSLKADVWTKKRVISSTGQISYSWQFWKTISCSVSSFSSTSFKAQGVNETFGELYEKMAYATMKTKEDIGRDVQITNIRNKTGVVYREIELKNSPPTWFNTHGSNPKTDPFGSIVEYETLLSRASEQGEKS